MSSSWEPYSEHATDPSDAYDLSELYYARVMKDERAFRDMDVLE